MSRSTADRVVVVEVAAEALLVGQPGDPHDHRVAERAAGEELQRRRLAAQLVLGVVQVGEVLDLRDRQQPADRRAEREAEDGSARRAACRTPGPRRAGAAARGSRRRRRPCAPTSSPNTSSPGCRAPASSERAVDALRQRQRPLLLGQPAAEDAGPFRVGRRAGGLPRDLVRTARRQRRHHLRRRSPAAGRRDRLRRRHRPPRRGPRRTGPGPRPGSAVPVATRAAQSPPAGRAAGRRRSSAASRYAALDVGAGVADRCAPCAGAAAPGRRCSRACSAASARRRSSAAGSAPSASRYSRPGPARRTAADPAASGVRHRDARARCPRRRAAAAAARPLVGASSTAALIAPAAVEWFAEASPKLHTAIASAGQRSGRAQPAGALDGDQRQATPTARGRCEAIVEVCGITARSGWPNTLWRPPAIGSSAAPARPSSDVAQTPSTVRPACARPGEVEGAGAVVQQRRVGRPQRRRHRRVALVARPSRSCRSPRPAARIRRAATSSWRLPACASNSASRSAAVRPVRLGRRRRVPQVRRRLIQVSDQLLTRSRTGEVGDAWRLPAHLSGRTGNRPVSLTIGRPASAQAAIPPSRLTASNPLRFSQATARADRPAVAADHDDLPLRQRVEPGRARPSAVRATLPSICPTAHSSGSRTSSTAASGSHGCGWHGRNDLGKHPSDPLHCGQSGADIFAKSDDAAMIPPGVPGTPDGPPHVPTGW